MSSTVLFNKVLTVLKIHGDDRRKCDILITVEEVIYKLKKEINLRLTEENDHFFLYQLKINEDDFQVLKAQQGLLIEFKAFPQKVIEMLEDCKERSMRDSKYSLMFSLSGYGGMSSVGSLSIVETNEFKQLNHLQLELHPGTDTDIKNYLLSNLKTTKSKLEQLSLAYNKSEFELKQCKESLGSRSDEVAHIRQSTDDRIKDIERSKEQHLKDMQRKHLDETKDLTDRFNNSIRRLELKVEDQTTSLQNMKDAKLRNDSQIAELKSALSSLDDEKRAIQSECSKVKREAASLDMRCKEQNHQLSDAINRLNANEKDLKNKEEILLIERNQLMSEKEAKRKLEEEVNVLKEDLEKQRKRLAMMVGKLEEYHEYKKENIELQAKLDKRTQVSNKQEQCIEQYEKEVKALRSEVKGQEMENKSRLDHLKKVEDENEKLRFELESKCRTLEENDRMIRWLSKQSNDNQINQIKTSPGYPVNRSSGHFLDFRNNNNNNNISRPIVGEEAILDPKYFRSSFEEPQVEPSKQMSPSVLPPDAHHSPQGVTNGCPVVSRISPATRSHAQYAGTSRQSQGIPVSSIQPSHITSRRGMPLVTQKNISPREPPIKTGNMPPLVSSYFPSKPPT